MKILSQPEITIYYHEYGERILGETFIDANEAAEYCEEIFGYQSVKWNDIKSANDFDLEVLYQFLLNDGVDVEWFD